MKIVIDADIPFIKGVFEPYCQVLYLKGGDFTKELVKDADALIIRTRTQCNQALLEGSNVKFIATATIGYDHIDTDYCRQAGITWTNAPGCNASSVAQYLQSSLLLLQRDKGFELKNKTIGIVGVGNVGRKVAEVAKQLGMRVLLNDPPRQAAEGDESFCSLQQLAEECDVITFHTPLNKVGCYKSYHLADEDFFFHLKRTPYIINSSRGEVVDTASLLTALAAGRVKDAIIDTWEYEPCISRELMEVAYIATPHIAGYSADGKANATRMSLEALCHFFHINTEFEILPPPLPFMEYSTDEEEAFLQLYNPLRDSEWLKASPEKFEWFRGNYPLRREV